MNLVNYTCSTYQKRLHILIEGDNDKDFFYKIIKPLFCSRYRLVILWKYGKQSKEKINNYIVNNIDKENDDCIFVTDIDASPSKRLEEYDSIRDQNRIIEVIKKIESWYIAVLTDDKCEKLGFISPETTDDLGKGRFKEFSKKSGFRSPEAFMQEILKDFDIETAKRKNASFKYFIDNFALNCIYEKD